MIDDFDAPIPYRLVEKIDAIPIVRAEPWECAGCWCCTAEECGTGDCSAGCPCTEPGE